MSESVRIKYGFVSRNKVNFNDNHVIIYTQMYRPGDFSMQNSLNNGKIWGILNGIHDLCYKNLTDGDEGVFIKGPE